MPPTKSPPSYRLHKPRQCAVVTIDGKNHYLGPYGSAESHEQYARLVTQWQAGEKQLIDKPDEPANGMVSVNELILGYPSSRSPASVSDGFGVEGGGDAETPELVDAQPMTLPTPLRNPHGRRLARIEARRLCSCRIPEMSDITRILAAIDQGDPSASEQLLPLVYDELRQLAAQRLAAEKPGQTLQATALVHEAYLRLVNVENTPHWKGRGHFFAAAAEAMRRILIENARQKGRAKRGGDWAKVDFDPRMVGVDMPVDQLLALDDALTQLTERDAQAAEIVKLHCFAGLSIEHAAATLNISSSTAYRDWAFAQAWLYREILGREPDADK
jgi:RNA polymerase sigma factor (TIGR02999 family)